MNLSVDEVMDQGLGQVAFSAYVDAAQAEGQVHDRLTAGSYAAARAVIGQLIERGYIRPKLAWVATHGTVGGYDAGCRCEYCTDATALSQRARHHWKARQGHNRVRV